MKLAEAITILLSHLLLFTCIVLTVWLPANLLVEYLAYHTMDPDDAVMGTMRLNMWIAGIFGPITAGAVVYAAARIKQGQHVSYGEAIGVGFQTWGRLFGARLVAGILIGLGLILLIVPGIYLAVRWALLDSAVVLEGAGVSESRHRSAQLVGGRELRIFGTGFFFLAGFLILAIGVSLPLEFVASLDNFVFSAATDCILDIFYVIIGIALFLYYWEARQEELGGPAPESAGRADGDAGDLPPWAEHPPDDGNPYRPPRS